MILRLRYLFLSLGILIVPSLALAQTDAAAQVCYQQRCLNLELASNQEQWRIGLMAHQTLRHDAGMLFIFPKNDYHVFWMKNMQFPLDLIWIDDKAMIVDVKFNQPPCPANGPCPSIKPKAMAKYVLEINAGDAKRFGWVTGKRLFFKHVTTSDVKDIPEHTPGITQ